MSSSDRFPLKANAGGKKGKQKYSFPQMDEIPLVSEWCEKQVDFAKPSYGEGSPPAPCCSSARPALVAPLAPPRRASGKALAVNGERWL